MSTVKWHARNEQIKKQLKSEIKLKGPIWKGLLCDTAEELFLHIKYINPTKTEYSVELIEYVIKNFKKDTDTLEVLRSSDFVPVNLEIVGELIGMRQAINQIKTPFQIRKVMPNLYGKDKEHILLFGPPGTGKTYFVKYTFKELAKDSDSALVAPSAATLKGRFTGDTEKNIAALFGYKGNGEKDLVIFLDEFDSVGSKRGKTEHMDSSVNQLLQRLDGINMNKHLSVIAATNYPYDLDDAILRRFSSRIFVDKPHESEYLKLIALYLKGFLHDQSDQVEIFVSRALGFSPNLSTSLINGSLFSNVCIRALENSNINPKKKSLIMGFYTKDVQKLSTYKPETGLYGINLEGPNIYSQSDIKGACKKFKMLLAADFIYSKLEVNETNFNNWRSDESRVQTNADLFADALATIRPTIELKNYARLLEYAKK